MTVVSHPDNGLEAVTLMQAAILARVHLANIYNLRTKLGAFKRNGVWHIPTQSLEKYIQQRAARARYVLANPLSALPTDSNN